MQEHYQKQRDITLEALAACTSSLDCGFVKPTAGMFIWLTFKRTSSTAFDLFEALAKDGVITVPGNDFLVPLASSIPSNTPADSKNSNSKFGTLKLFGSETANKPAKEPIAQPCLRITFAAANKEQIMNGVRVLGDTILTLPKNV